MGKVIPRYALDDRFSKVSDRGYPEGLVSLKIAVVALHVVNRNPSVKSLMRCALQSIAAPLETCVPIRQAGNQRI